MNEITKIKIKRQFTIWWSELRMLAEYMLILPIEIVNLLIKPIVVFSFYSAYFIYTILYIVNTSPRSKMLLFIGLIFCSIWVISSSEAVREYYNKRYVLTKK